MRELRIAGTQRVERFESDQDCVHQLSQPNSRCYEQPYPQDGVPRHLALGFIVPKLMLSTCMRLWGSLDAHQSTSARLMRYVEHLVQIVVSKCDVSYSHEIDALSQKQAMPEFFWTRAEHDNDYAYECHCMNFVVRTAGAHERFQNLFFFLAMRLNMRWPLSPRQFPLSVMNVRFCVMGTQFRPGCGNEPLVQHNVGPNDAHLHSPVTQRQSVSMHRNQPLPPRLNVCAFLDYFQNAAEISFSNVDLALDMVAWCKKMMPKEYDMAHRVQLGTSTESDLSVLLKSRVDLNVLQYQTLCGIMSMARVANVQVLETSYALAVLLPRPAQVASSTEQLGFVPLQRASEVAARTSQAALREAATEDVPIHAQDDPGSDSSVQEIAAPQNPRSRPAVAQSNPYALQTSIARPQNIASERSRHSESVNAYRERRARELSSSAHAEISGSPHTGPALLSFAGQEAASASVAQLQRPAKAQKTSGTHAAQRNFFV
jgi:hypothetical protein